MTWLIACERSGRIRDAMLARGIDAVSCDLHPSKTEGPHIQGDVTELLFKRWEGIIAHPECTYLTNAGSKHLYVDGKKANGPDPQRWADMGEAVAFFKLCLRSNAKKKAVENPIMHKHAANRIGSRATQFVQPWWFGEKMFKATGFHLEGLPKLVPTNKLTPPEKGTEEYKKWEWVFRMPPGPDRSEKRSETPQGIADAIADQWGLEQAFALAAE
ncbi:hypothetical protein Q5Y75_05755 [Ruegeria sp. 2205SS24-7]|uniref:hypothetical protein n=1 Tax=Ruegeria discodermiae TaxID=3064389 RepID=UPI002740DA11|nr:hypothetical protein [Ruegeria sp. 2205SS24-7]MDP5216716.1 hypothetical protein [Ruegeria sp. 2205SS24-7]